MQLLEKKVLGRLCKTKAFKNWLQENMKTKVLIASGERNEADLIPSGRFSSVSAQLLGEEGLLEERSVCGTLSLSL